MKASAGVQTTAPGPSAETHDITFSADMKEELATAMSAVVEEVIARLRRDGSRKTQDTQEPSVHEEEQLKAEEARPATMDAGGTRRASERSGSLASCHSRTRTRSHPIQSKDISDDVVLGSKG